MDKLLPINTYDPYMPHGLFRKIDAKRLKWVSMDQIVKTLPKIDLAYEFMMEDHLIQKIVAMIKNIGPVEKQKHEKIDTYEFDQLVRFFY